MVENLLGGAAAGDRAGRRGRAWRDDQVGIHRVGLRDDGLDEAPSACTCRTRPSWAAATATAGRAPARPRAARAGRRRCSRGSRRGAAPGRPRSQAVCATSTGCRILRRRPDRSANRRSRVCPGRKRAGIPARRAMVSATEPGGAPLAAGAGRHDEQVGLVVLDDPQHTVGRVAVLGTSALVTRTPGSVDRGRLGIGRQQPPAAERAANARERIPIGILAGLQIFGMDQVEVPPRGYRQAQGVRERRARRLLRNRSGEQYARDRCRLQT